MAYPGRIILTCSMPGMVCMNFTCTSAGKAEDIALKLADSGAIDLERNCFDGYEAITQRVAKAEELSEFDQYSEEDLK